jgi:hypothetical protein
MRTPVILAEPYPTTTYDTPASTHHVIIAGAELHDRRHRILKWQVRGESG